MTPYVGAKWGSAAVGSSGGTVTWSFATLTGVLISFSGVLSEAAWPISISPKFPESLNSDIRFGWDAIDGPGTVLAEAWWVHSATVIDRGEILGAASLTASQTRLRVHRSGAAGTSLEFSNQADDEVATHGGDRIHYVPLRSDGRTSAWADLRELRAA